ncbi:MAG: hypothetical protein AAGM67_14730 [Bacteroidota bacterium]
MKKLARPPNVEQNEDSSDEEGENFREQSTNHMEHLRRTRLALVKVQKDLDREIDDVRKRSREFQVYYMFYSASRIKITIRFSKERYRQELQEHKKSLEGVKSRVQTLEIQLHQVQKSLCSLVYWKLCFYLWVLLGWCYAETDRTAAGHN